MKNNQLDRRKFLGSLSTLTAAGLVLPRYANGKSIVLPDDKLNHIGPKAGYSPQIGTLVSMLDWLSNSVWGVCKKLSVEQLDYIHDDSSNSVGSLMLHLAATEVIYQDITLFGLDDFSKENKAKWDTAMNLGNKAQKEIKGNSFSYYKEAMIEVRNKTNSEMKKKDDDWFLSGETKDWDWNNYCKWFHVAEHFANHRGQMTWYIKRM